jgi:putative MFS transporter
LALMIGASDVIKPQATMDAIVPGFLYFAAWMVLCGCAFLFFGFETGQQSLTAIDAELGDAPVARQEAD